MDPKKITAEQRLDDKYLLSSSDPDLSVEDVPLGYKNLVEAERGSRNLNHPGSALDGNMSPSGTVIPGRLVHSRRQRRLRLHPNTGHGPK